MKKTTILLGAVLIALSASVASAQATLIVPGSYPTIQAAINAAANGDTVLVGPGNYNENLVISNKTIELLSTGGSAVTVVNGGQNGPCLKIELGLSRALKVEGFTFENGLGASAMSAVGSAEAGGIDLRNSSVSIRFCVVRNCVGGDAAGNAIAGAGGIQCRGPGVDAGGAFIQNCLIENCVGGQPLMNPTGGLAYGEGGAGGIQGVESVFYARACIIQNNVGGPSAGGPNFAGSSAGGIGLVLPFADTRIEDCEIHMNQGGDALVGATYAGAGGIGSGPGLPGTAGGDSTIIRWNNIGDNVGGDATQPGQLAGAGGIDAVSPCIELTYVRNNIGGNSDPLGQGAGAGGVAVTGNAKLIGSVIGGNTGGTIIGGSPINEGVTPGGVASGGAGGLGSFGGAIQVLHCTIANNQGGTGANNLPLNESTPTGDGAGGLHIDFGSADVKNSILWGNMAGGFFTGPINQIGGPGIVNVTYSDVQGSFPGMGNIDMDPLFVDPMNDDYHIDGFSPCVDAGLSGDPLQEPIDLDTDTRVFGQETDMGADESVAMMLPGSLEGLSIESEVNSNGAPHAITKCITVGDVVELRIFSPQACHLPSDMVLLATPYVNGTPPTAVPSLPNFHLNPNALLVLAPGLMPVSESAYGCGKAYVFPQTATYPGWTVRIQGIAVDASAANGYFALSPAHELCFQ